VGKITIQSKCYFVKAGGFCRGLFISRIFLQETLGSAAESSVLCIDLSCTELVFRFLFSFRMRGERRKEKNAL